MTRYYYITDMEILTYETKNIYLIRNISNPMTRRF